jgi:hypothetical protein
MIPISCLYCRPPSFTQGLHFEGRNHAHHDYIYIILYYVYLFRIQICWIEAEGIHIFIVTIRLTVIKKWSVQTKLTCWFIPYQS